MYDAERGSRWLPLFWFLMVLLFELAHPAHEPWKLVMQPRAGGRVMLEAAQQFLGIKERQQRKYKEYQFVKSSGTCHV